MIITPVTWDTTFQQNATWEFYSRFCAGAVRTRYEPATGLFSTVQPHLRQLNQPVVLGAAAASYAAAAGEALPVGFRFNLIYYVIADGLTGTTFKLAATPGGPPIVSVTAGGEMISAVPMDLQGAVVDCDIVGNLSNAQVGTFAPTIFANDRGLVRFRREAQESTNDEAGIYRYDCSITFPDGTRVYPQRGLITVEETVSRENQPMGGNET